MLPSEALYPYTAKEARERGELELWRANFRTNCACAGAIELAIRRDFDGMHLGADCAKSVIDQYGYKRVGLVLANTLQEQSYDGRYHETNKKWSRTIFVPEDGGHRHTFLINSHPAVLDGFVSEYRAELAKQWAEADLVVTSYDLMRRDEELYNGQQFYACILDEAQAIKNHTTQKYKAVCGVNSKVRFALTGTPVENRLGELWSIFSFLMPGYLPPYKTFCARFEKPIVQEDDKDALRRLNQLTGPFILRRMKSEVLKELPPKTENLHRIELDEQQRKLYLAAVVDAREKLRAAKPEDKMAVFAVLMRLREICCDPRLVADNWDGGSAKLDACMELVTAAVEGGHRILLFSQFTSMLELLAKRLDEAGVSHFTLQGSTPKPVRAELVRRFNSGEADVFLISLRAGGTGLNLTAADIVIHYDPWWNVAAQNQATDRAYRIGQRNPVQVYKLIAQDTIEEKIVELQQAKQDLAETVTGSADGAILSMKPEELLQLLQEE